MTEPHISIIIPVYNAELTIRKCVESLMRLAYKQYDIVIVDDGSTDKTKQILSEYKGRIALIELEHNGPSFCRNKASQGARGEYVAFTDADCVVDERWLQELLRGFDDEKVAAVGGSQYSPSDETMFGKMVQSFFELTGFLGGYIKKKDSDRIIEVEHNPSCNAMYRKNIFLEIGGFDEGLWPSEDVDLDYRLKNKGYRFRYNPQAKVYHYRPQTLKKLCRMMYRYGVMQGILTKRYGVFRRIQYAPVIFIASIFLIIFRPFLLFFSMAAFYCVVLFQTKSAKEAGVIIFLSIVSLFSWMSGFFRGFIGPKK